MGTSGFIKRGWGGGVTDVFTWDWVRGTVCDRTAYASLTPASGGAALSWGQIYLANLMPEYHLWVLLPGRSLP